MFKEVFIFPGVACSVNKMYFQQGRRRVLTKDYRDYKETIKKIIGFKRLPPVINEVKIKLVYFQPDNRKRDIDNIIKPILDGITQSGYWADDSIVIKVTAEKKPPHIFPRVVCTIEGIEKNV